MIPTFLRTRRPALIALTLSTGALFAAGFAPLFDGPGYEIALAAGLVVPTFAAIATALEGASAITAQKKKRGSREPPLTSEAGARGNEAPPSERREEAGGSGPDDRPEAPTTPKTPRADRGLGGPDEFTSAGGRGASPFLGPEPFDLLGRGVANGAVFAFAAYLTTLVHGLRTGFCDVAGGTWTFLLGPFAGALLGGAWGALAAEIAARRARPRARVAVAILAAIAGPLASAAMSFARFLTSPMVFAYDPFAGYFSGTLYDTVIDSSGLVTYRAGSALTLLAAAVLAWHLRRTPEGRLELTWKRRAGVALAGALCALASATHAALGPDLGHYQTPASIASALGARAEGARCTVLHPRGLPPDEIARFVADCDANVAEVEAWFEARGPERITVYLFGDVRQKAYLMGAADTQIAKPWRREVYVQTMPYPHPVIGHELAHVIAGAFARGPFKVGADAGGLLPNPGLIEGVAVAASPREGDLSPAEWARAMKDLGILPKLDRLFALSFLGASSGVAYTVSGAFVAFVKDTFGAPVVRAWYGGKPLPEAAGVPWPELEARFLASLDALVLSDAARAQAKARFDRPGIFGRRCPHVVDACNRRADGLRGAGDEDGALEQYARVRELDPNDAMVRVQIARTRLRKGDLEQGRAELTAIAEDEKTPRHVRDRALEDLADLALAPGGDGALAAATYDELMRRTADEDTLRTLEVKALAGRTPHAREAIHQFLLGAPGRGADRVRAAELLGVWSREVPGDGMPHYLMARYLHGAGLYAEAAPRLEAAIARALPTTRVEVEALRLRLVGACAVGDPIEARRAYDAYRARPEVPRARRDAMAALVARCAGDRPPLHPNP